MRRLWLVACVAREFGQSPLAVARELDDDPERTGIECLKLLRYAEAKSLYDAVHGDWKKMPQYRDSDLMRSVEKNHFALVKENRGNG